MKKIAPRISDQAGQFLERNFKTVNAGAEYCMDALAAVYRLYVGYELKKKFTPAELKLMIDVMNGTLLNPGLAGSHISANVADGIALDKLDEKWGIDGPTMLAKLAVMSLPEKLIIEIWVQAFWENCDDLDLEKYVS